jgi:D-cysteine desulfhydrase
MQIEELAIERRFAGLAGRLDRFPLTALPTPVHPLRELGRAVGIERLWVKRDDQSGHLYGGNKPRKLEFLLGAALRCKRRAVLTFGGLGSNHALATTIAARAAGLRTMLVLVPQPMTEHVPRVLLLDRAYGAELHYAPTLLRAAATTLGLLVREALHGTVPVVIPVGGSSAVGTIGYVNAALELAEQVRAGELPEPDVVFVPIGSGGTAAGLVLGLALAGMRSRVVGVLVTDILPPTTARVVRLARASLRVLRRLAREVPLVTPSASDLTIVTGQVGPGYGAPTPAAETAARLIEEREGIRLETTYTAKCLAALLEVARHPPSRDQTLLFWNTYSSVDPAAGVGKIPDTRDLPPPFRRLLEAR